MASQTITGPELQYTQDNRRCFAYSGLISVDNNETILINSKNGSQYIVARIQYGFAVNTGDTYLYKIYLNDFCVQSIMQGREDFDRMHEGYLEIIIPPYAIIKCTADNVADTTSNLQIVSLTGRVYEHLPVRN